MTWESISDFFSKLFAGFTTTNTLALLLTLLVICLLVWFFTRLYFRKKLRRQREDMIEKDKMIDQLNQKLQDMESELELKTADLKKTELSLQQLEEKHQKLALQHEQAVQEKNELIKETETLRADLEKAQEEEIIIEETTTANGSMDNSVNPGQIQALFIQTEQRMAALEQRVLELEAEEREILVFENDELDGIEDVEEDEDFMTEERVEAARKTINKALGHNISKATIDERDDLKRIDGIGPFIEQKLNELGIFTYQQISQFDPPFIQSLTEAIQFFPGRIDRDDWVGQAKGLMENV